MNKKKPTFYISCPIDTYSGYGARARDLVSALIDLEKYDVKIVPQKWGTTPWGFIEDNPEWAPLKDLFVTQITERPDIWAQITIPSEFKPIGTYNIGITAGIEATVCSPDWIEGLNRMDVNFVSSTHSKEIFESLRFEKKHKETQQVMGMIEVTKPIEVLFEGVDTSTYKKKDKVPKDFLNLGEIKEDFAFLHCGMWLEGIIGEDRKNIGLTIKAFYETFKNKAKKPALLLKVSAGSSSYMSRDKVLAKIAAVKKTVKSKNLPNVYLLNGDLTDEEMNDLYNHPKVKAMISLTKGEGFGRPLLEFTTSQKPLITTNWSGQLDYLDPEFTTLLKGELTNIHPSAANQWLLKEGQWFSVDFMQAGGYLRDVFENYKKYKIMAKRQARISTTEFSWDKMKDLLGTRLDELLPVFPEHVELKLPKLSLPKLKKPELSLPKLKKN